MNSIELGKFLANLRNEKKLTQEELAEKLFIDKRKVSRWECGTSIPEFDMLIKLSEIFDVSLYELSICKRIDKEKISKKTLNKFKSIKDFKKYKLKKKIYVSVIILFLIIFGITLTYTIRNQGSVEIYELKSLDDNYHIDGNYTKYGNNVLLTITSIKNNHNNNIKYTNSNCTMQINNAELQMTKASNNKVHYVFDQSRVSNSSLMNINANKKYILKTNCNNESTKELNTFSFDFIFEKIYDNNLFSF